MQIITISFITFFITTTSSKQFLSPLLELSDAIPLTSDNSYEIFVLQEHKYDFGRNNKVQNSFIPSILNHNKTLNKYPDTTAVRKITSTIIATSFFLNILASMVISGMAIPAPPIMSEITAPILIPLLIRANPIGIAVSARIYRGMPKTAAIGIANGCSVPQFSLRNPVAYNRICRLQELHR